MLGFDEESEPRDSSEPKDRKSDMIHSIPQVTGFEDNVENFDSPEAQSKKSENDD